MSEDVPAALRVIGEVRSTSAEDPLGPGDPLEVARLVRRALAAAGRRATDVDALVLVADEEPDAAGLARFTRRALGPVGAEVPSVGAAGPGLTHDDRLAMAERLAQPGLRGGVAILVVRGPGEAVTVRCVAAAAR